MLLRKHPFPSELYLGDEGALFSHSISCWIHCWGWALKQIQCNPQPQKKKKQLQVKLIPPLLKAFYFTQVAPPAWSEAQLGQTQRHRWTHIISPLCCHCYGLGDGFRAWHWAWEAQQQPWQALWCIYPAVIYDMTGKALPESVLRKAQGLTS